MYVNEYYRSPRMALLAKDIIKKSSELMCINNSDKIQYKDISIERSNRKYRIIYKEKSIVSIANFKIGEIEVLTGTKVLCDGIFILKYTAQVLNEALMKYHGFVTYDEFKQIKQDVYIRKIKEFMDNLDNKSMS